MEERRVKENLAGQRRGRSLPLLLSLSLSLSLSVRNGRPRSRWPAARHHPASGGLDRASHFNRTRARDCGLIELFVETGTAIAQQISSFWRNIVRDPGEDFISIAK